MSRPAAALFPGAPSKIQELTNVSAGIPLPKKLNSRKAIQRLKVQSRMNLDQYIPSYPTNSLKFIKAVRDESTRTEPAKVRLIVVVVGAGLGGLATAIALARRGHTVTVFEQAPALGEVCVQWID